MIAVIAIPRNSSMPSRQGGPVARSSGEDRAVRGALSTPGSPTGPSIPEDSRHSQHSAFLARRESTGITTDYYRIIIDYHEITWDYYGSL